MVFSVVNLQLHILVNQLSLPILSGIAHTDFIQVFYIFLIIVYHLEVGEGLSLHVHSHLISASVRLDEVKEYVVKIIQKPVLIPVEYTTRS